MCACSIPLKTCAVTNDDDIDGLLLGSMQGLYAFDRCVSISYLSSHSNIYIRCPNVVYSRGCKLGYLSNLVQVEEGVPTYDAQHIDIE